MMIFLLGASGYLGNYLFDRLHEQGLDVHGTYFSNPCPRRVYFDLATMSFGDIKIDLKMFDFVIFSAAANTRIDDSKLHYESSYHVNVTRTKELLDTCFVNGVTPIYFSTDNVFDGTRGDYSEGDLRNPINCYGRMRFEVENHLFDSGAPFVLLRFSKVFGVKRNDGTLLTEIIQALEEKGRISVADDQRLSPLFIEDLALFILDTIKHKRIGIFHLASTRPVTRFELATTIQKQFDLDDTRIRPCRINDLGLLEKRPVLTSLDVRKYRNVTGCQVKEISHFLEMIA